MKYTETRSESMVSAHHGRDVIQDITLTARRDGTVTGLDVKPHRQHGRLPGHRHAGRAAARRVHVQRASTSSPPTGSSAPASSPTPRRPTPTAGAGRPEATYAIERIMDELAVELGLDPMEVRRRNWIRHEEFPFTHRGRARLRLGQLRGGHRQGDGSCSGYDELRAEQAARRASNDPVQLGIGISTYTEMCGLAPVAGAGRAALRRRRLGVGDHPGAAHRQGRGGQRVDAARPGPRDRVEPDRRRPARACRSRTSTSCTETPGSRTRAWTPTARARSPWAASPW